MSSISPLGHRDYTLFTKEYYDRKDAEGQNSPWSKTPSQKQKSSIADPSAGRIFLLISSSLGISSLSSSTSFLKLLEVEQTLFSIEKDPKQLLKKHSMVCLLPY